MVKLNIRYKRHLSTEAIKGVDGLSLEHWVVYGTICKLSEREGYCYASRKYLSEEFGWVSKKGRYDKVDSILRLLKEKGCIRIERTRSPDKKSNLRIYPLLFDSTEIPYCEHEFDSTEFPYLSTDGKPKSKPDLKSESKSDLKSKSKSKPSPPSQDREPKSKSKSESKSKPVHREGHGGPGPGELVGGGSVGSFRDRLLDGLTQWHYGNMDGERDNKVAGYLAGVDMEGLKIEDVTGEEVHVRFVSDYFIQNAHRTADRLIGAFGKRNKGREFLFWYGDNVTRRRYSNGRANGKGRVK